MEVKMNLSDKKKVWSLRYTPGNRDMDAAITDISTELNISSVSARLAYNRGYTTPEDVRGLLSSSVSGFHDPREMKDMDRAVLRINKALESGEKIVIYGDYDVDGVTSVTLIYLYLKSRGADVGYYIPSRTKDGYGLSVRALDALRSEGYSLVITVDTGITANNEADYARSLGMEMVITDVSREGP